MVETGFKFQMESAWAQSPAFSTHPHRSVPCTVMWWMHPRQMTGAEDRTMVLAPGSARSLPSTSHLTSASFFFHICNGRVLNMLRVDASGGGGVLCTAMCVLMWVHVHVWVCACAHVHWQVTDLQPFLAIILPRRKIRSLLLWRPLVTKCPPLPSASSSCHSQLPPGPQPWDGPPATCKHESVGRKRQNCQPSWACSARSENIWFVG